MRKLRITEMDRLSVEEYKESRKTPLVVVLDHGDTAADQGSVLGDGEDPGYLSLYCDNSKIRAILMSVPVIYRCEECIRFRLSREGVPYCSKDNHIVKNPLGRMFCSDPKS